MSTLLTPIITQLEIDRDRFKILINGDETETVQLENRVELSIAGQVKERIDSLSINLTTAVAAAEAARDAALLAKDESVVAKDASVSAKNDSVAAKDEAVSAKDTSVSAKNSAEQFRNEAEGFRNEAEAFANGGVSYIPRYETDSLAVDPADGIIDVAVSTVWRVDGTQNWDLVFPDAVDFTYDADRSQSVIVFIEGSGGDITWPSEVSWAGGNEPVLGTTWTNVVLFWTGSMWIGMESAKR